VRIQLVSPYAPEHDGIADYSAMLAGELQAQGHDVKVLAPTLLTGAPPVVNGALGRTRRSALQAAQALSGFAPDVIHIQFCIAAFGPSLPALMLLLWRQRRSRIPTVLTLHDVTRDTAMLGWVGRRLYRWLCGLSDAVIVHTDTVRLLVEVGVGCDPRKVNVIAHPKPSLPPSAVGPDELATRYGLTGRDVLLSFGFIHVDKGLDDLVRALALLVRADQELRARIRLVVAGSVRRRRGVFRLFELRDELHLRRVRALVKRAGLEELIEFTGYVPSNEVRPWFDLAGAVVLPYRKIEQSGVASLASAAGTPVLPSDVGELAAFAAHEDWVYPPRAPAQLADAVRRFLASPSPGNYEHRSGAELADIAARTLETYRSLSANRS
jgi:glycosyltransferase involved in cell wall biosynthesis